MMSESEISLKEMQHAVHRWIQENGGYWEELAMLARLTEEVGELAREYNHRFGPKKKKASEASVELADEMSDVLWILLCMANQQGIDMEKAFAATMRKISDRDGGRFTSDEGA
jgi:NTP pyrophosphatase (non-canonical NTP hydrolase)